MKATLFNLTLLLSLVADQPVPTRATWSIVAIDKTTDQMGSAMATCLDNDSFADNAKDFLDHGFLTVPCQGAIVAQATIQDETGPAATVGEPLLQTGATSAEDILAAMTTPQADPGSTVYEVFAEDTFELDSLELHVVDLRQYGIVSYNDNDTSNPLVASYTGPHLTTLYQAFGFDNTEETSESIVTDNYTASVQGNIVFPETVAATAAAFRDSTTAACDFVERLFQSLKQGYLETGGDVRCADHPDTKGAVLAYLKVVEADGTVVINLEARLGMSENASALDAIEAGLVAWRQDHPCGRPQQVATTSSCGTINVTAPTTSVTSAPDNNANTITPPDTDPAVAVPATLEEDTSGATRRILAATAPLLSVMVVLVDIALIL